MVSECKEKFFFTFFCNENFSFILMVAVHILHNTSLLCVDDNEGFRSPL